MVCTCTGGPFRHGPGTSEQVLKEIAERKEAEEQRQKEEEEEE